MGKILSRVHPEHR